MASQTKQTTQTNGRDQLGRFAAGNSYGRLPKRTLAYARAFDEACDVQDLRDVVNAMIGRAKQGSVSAARLVLEYALGKPTVRVEISDDEEYRVAGVPPDEHREQMLQRLVDEIANHRAQGKATDSGSNGEGAATAS